MRLTQQLPWLNLSGKDKGMAMEFMRQSRANHKPPPLRKEEVVVESTPPVLMSATLPPRLDDDAMKEMEKVLTARKGTRKRTH